MTTESKNKRVSTAIAKLYLSSELADVEFVFKIDEETEKIPAHKNILASSSPVFHAMFLGPIRESDTVKIIDSNPEVFKEFLKFFYLEEVKLTMENMEEVIRLCDKYDMTDALENYVSSFIGKLTIEDICWAYQLAVIAKHQELELFCVKNICVFPDDVFKSGSFLHCNREVLERILHLETLACRETVIFQACIAWAKHHCQRNEIEINSKNLKAQLGDCFYLIRFCSMSADEIVENTLPYEEMFTRDDLANIMYYGTEKFSPNLFVEHERIELPVELKGNSMMVVTEHNTGGNYSKYQIQNTESVWFSSNKPLILAKFHCYNLRRDNNYAVNVTFSIVISEVGAQSFNVIAPTKVIFNGTADFNEDKEKPITLEHPIIINPRKMYEVRLTTSANISNHYYQALPWKSESKLDENITVKFHRNPSHDRRGLVSRFFFYQL